MNPVYSNLSRISFLSKKYTLKFLFIAFLGIHIPLIGLILYIVSLPENLTASTVIVLTLVLTLGATVITLFILNGLLEPLRMSRQALQQYLNKRVLPQLPVHFRDEAGLLMQHIHFTIHELNDLLEEKKDLTALLSHDLRIPMKNVETLTGILQQQKGDEPVVKELTGMIIESVQEQQSLLNEVLDILKQDYLFTRNTENANVVYLVEESIESLAHLAESKHIRIVTDFKYRGEISVQPELFKQVVKNLLSNAIKFSYEEGKITVTVFAEHEMVKIRVTDEGMGFDQEIAEKLFDRFTKNGRKGTAGEASTGIGLYLSRKIVKHQRGELKAYSNGPGTGASFTISI